MAKTNEWRKLHHEERRELYQRPNTVGEIVERRPSWAGRTRRKRGAQVKRVIEENPTGKRPLTYAEMGRWRKQRS